MRLPTRRSRGERGAALPIVAMTIVILLGAAAFGTDLAWFYISASRAQRAADASALAGVVWMPGDQVKAFNTAYDIASRNGFPDGAPNIAITPGDVAGEANQLEVSVHAVVDTFFLKVLGIDAMTINRTARAEYIPPLRLGSDTNQFGNACDPTQAGCTGQSNFWANIHGKWTAMTMGDAYSSWCATASDDPTCVQNPIARTGGYLYGIESPNQFTLQFIDLAFRNTHLGNPTSDYIRTGDRGCEDWGPSSASTCGPTMYVALYAPDPTPLDISDNTLLCSATISPQGQVLATAAYTWASPTGATCWTQTGPGIYVVEVRHVDPGAVVDRAGLNRYSVRANGAGAKLFALGDFSIYNNADISTTQFFLAEVPDYYAGKTFVVELYDPGESTLDGTLQVIDEGGTVFTDGECRVYDRNNTSQPWALKATILPPNPCEELVTPGEYNGRWLKFEMDLPSAYSCTTCWWQMNYAYTSSVNDTTTWRAYMVGNPIHLVPS